MLHAPNSTLTLIHLDHKAVGTCSEGNESTQNDPTTSDILNGWMADLKSSNNHKSKISWKFVKLSTIFLFD